MTAPRSPWHPDHPDEPNIVPPAAPTVRPEPQRAEGDVLIDRPELGPDAATLITAGQVIPAHLAALPRRPARPDDQAPPKRGRH